MSNTETTEINLQEAQELEKEESLALDVSEIEKAALTETAEPERFDAGKLSPKEIDATKLYLQDIEYSHLLTADEEKHYARLALKGDEEARKTMIVSNLRLVIKIARRYMNRGMDLLDLIEEGNLGLIHAVEKFDPEKGFRFSTYATWWIRQTIERALMNQSRTIRLPIHVIKEMYVYLKAARKIQQESNHQASAEEIAEKLDVPVEDVFKMLDLQAPVGSLDAQVSYDNERPMVETISNPEEQGPLELLQLDGVSAHIDEWLDQLEDKHRQVMIRRFGLKNCDRATLEVVGEELGVTRERVRQIQIEGLRKLRKILDREGIKLDNLIM